MHATKRQFEPSVIQQLLKEPHRFQFFQAVRLLSLWLQQQGVLPSNLVADHLRFRNSLSLSFPASEIEKLTVEADELISTEEQLSAAFREGSIECVSITPAFMGFLGGSGVLPLHYTERIASHLLYQRDDSPRAFLDAFSNRPVALLFEAWSKYRVEYQYSLTSRDQFLSLLMSFAGLGQKALAQRLDCSAGPILDASLASYAAALRQRPASAAILQSVLSDYFSTPVLVQQFIGCWYDVPKEQQSVLGQDNAVLGYTALAGARVWQRDLRLRLTIGPLKKSQFYSFLPRGAAAATLSKLLEMFTGPSVEYEVELILHEEEVQGVTLSEHASSGRLGWDTFMTASGSNGPRNDVHYLIHQI